MKIYLVGGAVRDKILNIENQDHDFVVIGETAESMISAGFKPIEASEFPIFIKNGDEYALGRKERKTSNGYQGFEVAASPDVTLEEDLSRRDLTINSIAERADGSLVDPFNGISDIQNRVLRHTSPAFSEDPVRVLRVARFMAQLGNLNFTVAPETMTLMRELSDSGELDYLSNIK